MSIGIYKIISPTGKIYIGQSVNIEQRWRDYRYTKSQIRLIRSFNKHGIENHCFEIVELCDIENLNEREFYWQKYYNVLGEEGLNCEYTDPTIGKKTFSEESKVKMSLGRTGEKNHRFGKKQSISNIEKLRQSRIGKKTSEETKLKRRKTIGDKQKRGGNPRARKVICVVTGKEFGCISDGAEYLGMNRKTLNDQLIGRYPNKTSFLLCEMIDKISDGGI